MRAAAALLVGLVVAVSGCGSDGTSGSLRGIDAAKLVPPEALAFFSAEDEETTGVWQTLDGLPGGVAISTGESYALLDLGADRPAVVGFVKVSDDVPPREFPTFFRD